jgi:hypothetical protein
MAIVRKKIVTIPTTSGIQIQPAKVFQVQNSMMLLSAGDSGVLTLPNSTDTLMGLATTDTITGAKTFAKDKLLVKGTSTGTTNLTTANTSATSYTATLPAKDGTVAMTSDIVSQVEDNITDGHTTIAPSGNAVFDALALKAPLNSPTFVDDITIGGAGVATGIVKISGTTSGTVSITTAAEAGTWTMTLPANDGDSGQVLTTNGSGVCTWAAAGGVPTTITVANEATDETCFPLFVTAATGDLGPKTVANLTLNSNTGSLGVGALVSAGAISGTTIGGTIITASTQLISDKSSDTPATCPLIDMRRSRDGNPTDDVSDDDYLGELRFRGYKTDGYYEGAIIRAVVNGTPGAGDMPAELIFATSADGSATPTTRLTIDAAGLSTFAGGVALGANSLTMTGSLAATGARATKGWFTDIESTNMPTVGGTAILTSLTAPQFTTIELGHATENTLSASGGVLSIEGTVIPKGTGTANEIAYWSGTNTLGTLAVATYPSLTELSYVKGVTSAIQTQLGNKAPSANPTFTGTVILPKTLEIQDTSADHQYVLAVSELTADRTVTLPLLTGNDEFVFKAHTQTLTNKRITKRVASTTDDATAVIDCDSYDDYYLTAVANATEISVTGTPTNGQTIFIGLKDAGVAKGLTWTGITGLGVTLPTTTVAGKQHIIGIKYIASAWRAISVAVES